VTEVAGIVGDEIFRVKATAGSARHRKFLDEPGAER
jgi:hypothetical protein